jgi:hypothetical protein
VICTIPSDPAAAKPSSAALSVCDDVTLTAGYAKPPVAASSSIAANWSGCATGTARR